MTKTAASGRARRFALLVALVAALGIAALIVPLPSPDSIRRFVAELPAIPGFFAVFAVALALLCMVPRTFVSITCGLIFGWLHGFVYVLCGGLLAAGVAFALGHWLGRDFIADRMDRWSSGTRGRRLQWWQRCASRVERSIVWTDSWIARHGVVGMWAARVLPISHFGLLSYACGAVSVRFRHFVAGTGIGSTPGALGYTAVGSAVIGEGGLPLAMAIMMGLNIVGLGVTAIVMRRLGRGGVDDGTAMKGGESELDAALFAIDRRRCDARSRPAFHRVGIQQHVER
ncbi:MAG TPA: VTT domain-containing protein [Candidatus Stackebrandtia faecavium]|nr:VTT domain-containing protein [Candidatus Stackebrandtia faecavium]